MDELTDFDRRTTAMKFALDFAQMTGQRDEHYLVEIARTFYGFMYPGNNALPADLPPEQPTSVDTSVEVKMPSPNGIASGVYTPPPAETD